MHDDLMIDLETMGTGQNAAIVAIGAVLFNPQTGVICPQHFYTAVDLRSSVSHGLEMDAETVLWWLRKSEEARAAICGEGDRTEVAPLSVALDELRDFIETYSSADRVRVWGNGASFDCVILGNAYRAVGDEPPWKYFNERCYRTAKAMLPAVPFERIGTHHHALDDAASQAQHLIKMLRAQKSTLPRWVQELGVTEKDLHEAELRAEAGRSHE